MKSGFEGVKRLAGIAVAAGVMAVGAGTANAGSSFSFSLALGFGSSCYSSGWYGSGWYGPSFSFGYSDYWCDNDAWRPSWRFSYYDPPVYYYPTPVYYYPPPVYCPPPVYYCPPRYIAPPVYCPPPPCRDDWRGGHDGWRGGGGGRGDRDGWRDSGERVSQGPKTVQYPVPEPIRNQPLPPAQRRYAGDESAPRMGLGDTNQARKPLPLPATPTPKAKPAPITGRNDGNSAERPGTAMPYPKAGRSGSDDRTISTPVTRPVSVGGESRNGRGGYQPSQPALPSKPVAMPMPSRDVGRPTKVINQPASAPGPAMPKAPRVAQPRQAPAPRVEAPAASPKRGMDMPRMSAPSGPSRSPAAGSSGGPRSMGAGGFFGGASQRRSKN